jgi:hypothetical protein
LTPYILKGNTTPGGAALGGAPGMFGSPQVTKL